MSVYEFHDPLSGQVVALHVGGHRSLTGVAHPGCDVLADVSPNGDGSDTRSPT